MQHAEYINRSQWKVYYYKYSCPPITQRWDARYIPDCQTKYHNRDLYSANVCTHTHIQVKMKAQLLHWCTALYYKYLACYNNVVFKCSNPIKTIILNLLKLNVFILCDIKAQIMWCCTSVQHNLHYMPLFHEAWNHHEPLWLPKRPVFEPVSFLCIWQLDVNTMQSYSAQQG